MTRKVIFSGDMMQPKPFYFGILIMALTSFFGGACDKPAEAAMPLPKPALDLPADSSAKPGETHDIIVAGGCFWCIEGVYDQLKGVTKAVSGYAGGAKETATYEAVCSGPDGACRSG